ncbi:lipid A 1-phosphatase LpxE, partial [Francisella tularensis subsp. holarctica]|nr:lipid A 1-phosphatase LpxE [Francisella tularensis subsp. holarctica]
ILYARLKTAPHKLSATAILMLDKVSAYPGIILATVSISGILGQILKMIIVRARPKFFLEYGSNNFQQYHAPRYDFASMPKG